MGRKTSKDENRQRIEIREGLPRLDLSEELTLFWEELTLFWEREGQSDVKERFLARRTRCVMTVNKIKYFIF